MGGGVGVGSSRAQTDFHVLLNDNVPLQNLDTQAKFFSFNGLT